MAPDAQAGAVVYAKDIGTVAAFYHDVVGLAIRTADEGSIVLESPYVQLFIVQVPAHIAETFEIEVPPVRRSDTAVKLVFPVASIAAARSTAVRAGGVVDPAEREWTFLGVVRCDGHDPEGNVIQLTEPAPA